MTNATEIHTAFVGEELWVLLRPSVEPLGLNYSNQLRKLKAKPWAQISTVVLHRGGQRRAMVVVSPKTWEMFMASLKVRGARTGDRHLYVAAFSSRMIKVGQTSRFHSRLREHDGEAQNHGHRMTRYWISVAHAGWADNEDLLIQFCRDRFGPPIRGSEYFATEDFDPVVNHAKSLAPSLQVDVPLRPAA